MLLKRRLDELLFAVEMDGDGRLNAAGAVTYSFAHRFRITHTTVLIVLMLYPAMRVVLMQRPRTKRLFPGCWDILGGHVTADLRAINSPETLEEVINQSALREAAEEAMLTRNGEPVLVDDHSLERFSEFGELFAESALNVERSTGYLLFLPDTISVSCADEGDHGRHEKLKQRQMTLDELKADYRQRPDTYADGAARLLKRLIDPQDPVTQRFEACIRQHC